MVRAKMRCTEVAKRTQAYGPNDPAKESGLVKLTAVYGPGNETWSRYTPSGQAELSITNPGAFDQFEVGKEYFVDFTPAEA